MIDKAVCIKRIDMIGCSIYDFLPTGIAASRRQYVEDMGFAFQNLVYLILREKLQWSGARIRFWRTTAKTEIDFVIDTGSSLIPVEVRYRHLNKASPPRALEGFTAKYCPARCLVINRSFRDTARLNGIEVRFMTVWDLLTEPIHQLNLQLFGLVIKDL